MYRMLSDYVWDFFILWAIRFIIIFIFILRELLKIKKNTKYLTSLRVLMTF